jgi:hypothetical protein
MPRTGPSGIRPIERLCYRLGGLLIVVGLFHLAVLLITGDSWIGPVSWRKPMTFGLSFGLTLLTIAWVSSYLRLSERTRTGLLGIFAAACVLEVGLITLQAWRQVPSHFNLSTTLDGTIARTLAAGGAVLIGVIVVLTVVAFRAADEPSTAASMRLAIRAGLVALDLALLLGAAMIATGITRAIAGDQQSAYVVGGALKLAHGVTLHGVLVLPGLAWLLARTDRSEAERYRLVRWAVLGYAGLCVVAVAWSTVGLIRLESI